MMVVSNMSPQEGEYTGPSVLNITIGDKRGYATGDLLQEHPSIKGYYKLYGRVDEQIVLSTGEKTNPVPLGDLISLYIIHPS
jgi:long-subunit acyl-CoA synthetase (AMP-forming)